MPDNPKDIEHLVKIFNDSVERLRQSYEKIAELRKQIAEKDEQLRQKSRLEIMGQFSSFISHEIRNPLAGLELQARLLKQKVKDEEAQRIIDNMLECISSLNRFINDVLSSVSRIEARKITIKLAPLIEEAISQVNHKLTQKAIRVIQQVPADSNVFADPVLIVRAISNLISNSADAVPNGGEIRISAIFSSEKARITISDNGGGIPAEILPKLFTEFTTTKKTGTGLGLALVKRIVEAHDGTITASNVESGAQFVIEIPQK